MLRDRLKTEYRTNTFDKATETMTITPLRDKAIAETAAYYDKLFSDDPSLQKWFLIAGFGAVLVAWWAKGLVADTAKVLLDREMDHPVVDEIREVIERKDDPAETRITDLHVWRIGKGIYACALTVVTHDRALTPELLRQRLAVHEEVVHSTIEIHLCPDAPAAL